MRARSAAAVFASRIPIRPVAELPDYMADDKSDSPEDEEDQNQYGGGEQDADAVEQTERAEEATDEDSDDENE